MTKAEFLSVALIAGDADGGCWVCVSNLLKRLQVIFPGRASPREIIDHIRKNYASTSVGVDDCDYEDYISEIEVN